MHIRELARQDVESLSKIFVKEEVTKYLLTQFYDLSSASQYIRSYLLPTIFQKEPKTYAVVDGNVCIGYLAAYDYDDERVKITYVLDSAYWSKGIVKDVLPQYMRYLFTEFQIHRIEAMCFTEHIASQKVLEALGFIREGILKEYTKVHSVYKDVVLYRYLQGGR